MGVALGSEQLIVLHLVRGVFKPLMPVRLPLYVKRSVCGLGNAFRSSSCSVLIAPE